MTTDDWGWPEGQPVSTYTDQDAINAGQLVYPYPDTFPGWLVTCGVFAAIEKLDDGRTLAQRLIPLLMDAQLIVRSKRDHLYTKGLEGNVTGQRVWIGQNGMGGFTLLFPEEY